MGIKNEKIRRIRKSSGILESVVSTEEIEMVNYTRNLPLYDSLAAKLAERVRTETISVDSEFKMKLGSVLNSLDPSRSTEVALLLVHYYFLNNSTVNPFSVANCASKVGKSNSGLPYGIKITTGGTGFHFDLDLLPAPFQALLGIYCSL